MVNNYSIKENKQNKVSGKSTYAEVNDFTIDTEQAIYIEDPNSSYSSYTFEVFRNESQNDNLLENLVISFPEDGYYKLTLIKYELTVEQKNKLENGLFVDLRENTITTSPVEDSEFEAQFNQKIALMEDGECFTLLETSCSYGNANHPGGISSGAQCPGYHENIIWTFCNSSNSGGGWDGSGPDNTGSNGNGGNGGPGGGPHSNGNNNPIVTSPIVGSLEAQIMKSFIKQLSPAQKIWWNDINNEEATNSIKAYVVSVHPDHAVDIDFVNDLIDLVNQNSEITNETITNTINEKSNDTSLNLQQAFTLAVINNTINPTTGASVEFYLLLKYKNSSFFDSSSFSIVNNSNAVGDYTLTPHYKSDNTLVYYSAVRYSSNSNNTMHDIEYIIKATGLTNFQQKIDLYTHAANLFYMNGVPSNGQIALMSGDYFSGLSQMWNDAIHSPQWWAYSITCFGHAIVSLPVNTTVSSTITTQQWRSSMKNLTNRALQGKTVSNPQGVNVTINIPDNYVPSISNNGQGINFRPSTPINPVYPDAGLIRVTQPGYSGGVYYPKGYVKFYNNYGQPYNPINGQTLSNANNHFKF